MEQIEFDRYVEFAFAQARYYAQEFRNEFIMPEHLLYVLLDEPYFAFVAEEDLQTPELRNELGDFLKNKTERVPDTIEYELIPSEQMERLLTFGYNLAKSAGEDCICMPHLFRGMMDLQDSEASFLLKKYALVDLSILLSDFITSYENYDLDSDLDADADFDDVDSSSEGETQALAPGSGEKAWKGMVTCVSDHIDDHNPLIGREKELERTIQVLCRKDKNNPLHVGEPGVGKTALIYGLAALLRAGKVPERLKGYKIYELNLGTLLAGTQYRGDFEKRLKSIMDGISNEGKSIVYIDEIHNLVGAGRTGDGSMDASNLLKPFLESGNLRFIGSTTYEEYNRFFSQDKALVRRFQQIDVPEPTVEEAVRIIEGLRDKYEEYHQVSYADGVIEFAVESSAKYVADRFLPDKAIDLIDEAGAYRELHPSEQSPQMVDKSLISDVLAKVCKIDAAALKEEENTSLETLESNILKKIYGQNEAVRQVVEAVQMSKAGLLDDDKPIASLLFVGPTGVGKTELCKVLAAELGVNLVRFDMSEYTEKHTVAKLIGSPAGYVGYEDGGLLTDAIRKTPNCVLLLDEIEKAHADIYNILLQVMDYARLTDNKGRKADFRHVILVMTSNAGAQYAHLSSIGFGGGRSASSAMVDQVKKIFKPEFINRLNGMVPFNDMDEVMASAVLDKKLNELKEKVSAKKVSLSVSNEAHAYLLSQGFSKTYGAREMDRVLRAQLSVLLMREILFGFLKGGGEVEVVMNNGSLKLRQRK